MRRLVNSCELCEDGKVWWEEIKEKSRFGGKKKIWDLWKTKGRNKQRLNLQYILRWILEILAEI